MVKTDKMTVNCNCNECDCKEKILSMDKDGQFLCASCRLGKHGHKVWVLFWYSISSDGNIWETPGR